MNKRIAKKVYLESQWLAMRKLPQRHRGATYEAAYVVTSRRYAKGKR